MRKKDDFVILKSGLGALKREKSFVVGFPEFDRAENAEKRLQRFLKILKYRNSAEVSPEHLLETAQRLIYDHYYSNYRGGVATDGFLYPVRILRKGWGQSEEIYRKHLTNALRTKVLMDVGYRSARRGYSGEPVLVERSYLGRVVKYSADEELFTLELQGNEFRTFKISQLLWLEFFSDSELSGRMTHVHLVAKPLEEGKALLSWEIIRNESSPLLTEPFNGALDVLEKEELKQSLSGGKTSTRSPEPPEGEAFKNLSALDALKALGKYHGGFILVTSEDDEGISIAFTLRLLGVEKREGSLKFYGEGGLEYSVDHREITVSAFGNSKGEK